MKICIHIITHGQEGVTARCPELPGCSTRAQTREKALELIVEAIRGYLAALGNFVPDNIEHELVDT